MRPVISIISPIHNTKVNDLKRCVKSITGSIAVSCEILLIDDGSEKYIEEICLRLKEEYKNIWEALIKPARAENERFFD